MKLKPCLLKKLFQAFVLPVFLTGSVLEAETAKPKSADVSKVEKPSENPELTRIQKELSLLTAKNRLREEKLKVKLADMENQIRELSIKNRMAAEIEKEKNLKLSNKIMEIQTKKRKLEAQNSLQKAEMAKIVIARDKKFLEMDSKQKEMNFEKSKLAFEQQKLDLNLKKMQREINRLNSEEQLTKRVTSSAKYLENPLQKGVLHLSDRRIPLNGPIVRGLGKKIADRIDFFNNRSKTLPIFIVINSSPGGSVREGFLILKSMQASKAPVHVVVKSFAASMAAAILTMAPHSYTLPNAVVLHHEMSAGVWGNMTEIKERVANLKKWEARLVAPLARRIGYRSIEAMRKDLYKNNSNGDWGQFGDEAQRTRWVKHVVSEIRETGILRHPEEMEAAQQPHPVLGLGLRRDSSGKVFHELPPLEAFDAYFLYNPANYYRIL